MPSATETATRTWEPAVRSSLPIRGLREALQVVEDAQVDAESTSSFTVDDYMGVMEAASLLGVHPDALRRMIRQKRLPAILVHRTYAIERTVVEMFAANYSRNTGEVHALL